MCMCDGCNVYRRDMVVWYKNRKCFKESHHHTCVNSQKNEVQCNIFSRSIIQNTFVIHCKNHSLYSFINLAFYSFLLLILYPCLAHKEKRSAKKSIISNFTSWLGLSLPIIIFVIAWYIHYVRYIVCCSNIIF